jgi:hypothetical protein
MFSILIIIFSFKFINYYINYNTNNNIYHTVIRSRATCALGLPNTLAVSPSATCALGLPSIQADNPSAQGWADRALGGCSMGRGQRAWLAQRPSLAATRQVSTAPVGAPQAWRLGSAGHSLTICPYQIVQSIVKITHSPQWKALTWLLQCITVKSTVKVLTMHSNFCYPHQTVQFIVKALTGPLQCNSWWKH